MVTLSDILYGHGGEAQGHYGEWQPCGDVSAGWSCEHHCQQQDDQARRDSINPVSAKGQHPRPGFSCRRQDAYSIKASSSRICHTVADTTKIAISLGGRQHNEATFKGHDIDHTYRRIHGSRLHQVGRKLPNQSCYRMRESGRPGRSSGIGRIVG